MADLKMVRVPHPIGGFDATPAIENLSARQRSKNVTNVGFPGDGVMGSRQGVAQGVVAATSLTGTNAAWEIAGQNIITGAGTATKYTAAGAQSTFATAAGYSLPHSAQFSTGATPVVYGIAGAASDSASGDIYQWAAGAAALTQITTGPRTASSVANFANRLFVGGGSVPGTVTPVFDNRLYFSDPGGPATNVAAEWTDDISGLTNQIVLDGAGDPILKLITFDRALYIIRARSIYRLTGSGPSTFTVTKVLNFGALAGHLVCQAPLGFVFANISGLFMYNGDTTVEIARNATDVHAGFLNSVPLVPYSVSMLLMSSDLLACQVLGQLYLYRFSTGAWVKITLPTSVGALGPLSFMGYPSISPVIFTATGQYWNLSNLCSLYGAGGSDSLASGSMPVAFNVSTPVQRLAAPAFTSQLHRVMIDYAFIQSSASSPPTLTCSVCDATTDAVLETFTLPVTTIARTRYVRDVFCEAPSVYLNFSCTSPLQSGKASVTVYIHDVWLEYSQAAQRRAG